MPTFCSLFTPRLHYNVEKNGELANQKMRSSLTSVLTLLLTLWASLELVCSKMLCKEQSGEAGSSGTFSL